MYISRASTSRIVSAFRHAERDKSQRACTTNVTMFKFEEFFFKLRAISFFQPIFFLNLYLMTIRMPVG